MCVDNPSCRTLQHAGTRLYIWLPPFRFRFAHHTSWYTHSLGILVDLQAFFPLRLVLGQDPFLCVLVGDVSPFAEIVEETSAFDAEVCLERIDAIV